MYQIKNASNQRLWKAIKISNHHLLLIKMMFGLKPKHRASTYLSKIYQIENALNFIQSKILSQIYLIQIQIESQSNIESKSNMVKVEYKYIQSKKSNHHHS